MANQKAVTHYGRYIIAKWIKAPMSQFFAEVLARTINRADWGTSVPQKVAASLTNSFVARGPGKVVGVRAMVGGALAAAGESMTFDCKIGTTSLMNPVITIDSTIAAGKWVNGVKDESKVTFVQGALVEMIRTYTAGGGPTPMTNTLFEVDIEYSPQR